MRNLFLFYSTFSTTAALLTHTITDRPIITSRSLINSQTLRILPIGDSITFGFGSTDGNGYRQRLLDLLDGIPATYLGSQHSGNMTNNNSEGYSGETISQIATYVAQSGSLSLRPDLVLIMAGTNDINLNESDSAAPERLGALIDEVRTACPYAAIIVSEITPNGNSAIEPQVRVFNAAIPALVEARSHVLAVNQSMFVPRSDLVDELHPTDMGYQLMAEAWLTGIQQAADEGWIEALVRANGTGTETGVASVMNTNATKGASNSTITYTGGSESMFGSLDGNLLVFGMGLVAFMAWM